MSVDTTVKIRKSDAEWQQQLTPEQFQVTRKHGTERAFSSHPGLRRLVARVHPDNRASARALEKAGYRRDTVVGPDGWHLFRIDRPRG